MLSLSSLKKKKKTKQANSCTCSYLVGDRFSVTRTQCWKIVWVEKRENCWVSWFTGQHKLATVPIKVIQCSLNPWVVETLMKLWWLFAGRCWNLAVFGYTKCSTCHHYPTGRKSAGQFSECTAVISHKNFMLGTSSRSCCHSGLQSWE